MKQVWFIWCAVGLGAGTILRGATNAPSSVELAPATVLAFDCEFKQVGATTNVTSVTFSFWVTNVCATNVLILDVTSSCDCATTQLSGRPWILQPEAAAPIKVTLDLQGRRGLVLKSVLVVTSAGVKALVMRVNLPDAPKATPRATNLTFQSSCVKPHVPQ